MDTIVIAGIGLCVIYTCRYNSLRRLFNTVRVCLNVSGFFIQKNVFSESDQYPNRKLFYNPSFRYSCKKIKHVLLEQYFIARVLLVNAL